MTVRQVENRVKKLKALENPAEGIRTAD